MWIELTVTDLRETKSKEIFNMNKVRHISRTLQGGSCLSYDNENFVFVTESYEVIKTILQSVGK